MTSEVIKVYLKIYLGYITTNKMKKFFIIAQNSYKSTVGPFMFKNSLFVLYLFFYFNSSLYDANIMKTQIFHKMKSDLNVQGRSQKALLAKFFLAHSFINHIADKNFVKYQHFLEM